MDRNNQQPQVESSGQPQVDNQEYPPSYTESVKNSSQTGYPQNPAAYPTQQGYAAAAAYPTQGYQPGGGYTNYGHQPYYPPPPPPPPPAVSNNNQTVIITQNAQDVVTVEMANYICLSIFAIFLFLPTGIVAFLKAHEAQNQYRMGNINSAEAFNLEARKFIRISAVVGLVLIITGIVIRVLQVKHYSNSYG